MYRILFSVLLLTSFSMSIPAWAVTNWSKAIPAVGDSKSSWPGQVTAQWSILDTLFANYIKGETLTYKNSTTITVSSGQVVVSNVGASLRLFLSDSGNTDITTANLDSGASFSLSMTYYVYAATSSSTASSSTYYISLSSSAPTGPTYYAQIGSFTTDSSGNIAGVQSTGITGIGTSVSKTASTIYIAQTDGFVVAAANVANNSQGELLGYTDSSVSPSTNVNAAKSSPTGGVNAEINVTFPVKKGNYYKVTISGASMLSYIFVPIGN